MELFSMPEKGGGTKDFVADNAKRIEQRKMNNKNRAGKEKVLELDPVGKTKDCSLKGRGGLKPPKPKWAGGP